MNLIEPSFDATTFSKNRANLLKHRVGQQLFDEVVLAADDLGLLSDEHFTVDGTLIEAAASLKSIKSREGGAKDPPGDGDGGARHGAHAHRPGEEAALPTKRLSHRGLRATDAPAAGNAAPGPTAG
jgi:hypothetical protein